MTPGQRFTSDSFPTARRTRRWAPLVALCATALLAACGGDDDGDDGPPADTTPPTVTVTDDIATGAASGDITFSFTFSEDVGTSFAATDVTVSAGAKGAFVKASATLYTLVVTPPANAAGDLTVTVPAGAVNDLAGNASTAAGSGTQAYDTVVALTQMTLPVTFDSATVDYGLVGFGGADDSTIVVDPTNAANHVAKVVKSATAEIWAGTTVTAVDGAVQLGFATKLPIDASNTRMTVRVWSPDAGIQVRLKAEDHTNPGITVETEATTTVASTWETLTFDFANEAAGTAALDVTKNYDKVSIFFNFGVGGATAGEKTYYFDDLVWIGGGGTGGGGGDVPTAAPARPTVPAADVISLLSDAYTNVSVDTWRTDWSAATLEDVTVGDDHVKKYSSLDFVGVETTGANLIDATQMTHVHLDLWTPNATTFRIKLVDFGADAAFGGGDDREHEIALTSSTTPALATGQWVSIDLPFSAFTGLTTRAHLAQHIFSALPTGAVTAYIANYYFYESGGGAPAFTTVTFDDAALTYTITDFEGAVNGAVVTDPAGGTNKVARNEKPAAAQPWAGSTISTGANLSVGKIPFAAGETRMTVRVYSPDAGIKVRLKVEDSTNVGISCETEATTTVANTWETLTFDFANQAAGTAALNVANTYDKVSIFFNFLTATPAGETRIYHYDDIAFIGGTTAPAGPTAAAPTQPARAAADVISLFAAAYTNVAVDTWKTGWTPGAVVLTDPYDVPGTDDDAKKYQFFDGANYAGVEFTGSNLIDATAMTHFHIDVWTPNATNFQVKLVDFGANGVFGGGDDTEGILTLPGPALATLAQGQWVSVDAVIDATNFPGLAARAHLAQMVFVSGAGAGTVFVDNIYFHK